MNLNNKRGVSGVVTAVLLILLVIAAIGILWVVVQNFIEQGTEGVEGTGDCFTTSYEPAKVDTAGVITVRRTAGSASVTVLRAAIDEGNAVAAADQTILTGASTIVTTGDAQTLDANVEVTIAFELSDGTACPVIDKKSISVTAP